MNRAGAEPSIRAWIATTLAAVVVALCSPAEAARRVALVIGISHYEHVDQLKNPLADADLVAQALRSTGFDVDVLSDASASQIKDQLRDFRWKAELAEIGLIYFAGHGIEIEGANFVLARDSHPIGTADAKLHLISIFDLETALINVFGLRLIILDACRDNPFQSIKDINGGPLRGNGGITARHVALSDMLFAYSAMHGSQALDGQGTNSPFAKALASSIRTQPGNIHSVLGAVRDKVISTTRGEQLPFVYGSIGTREYVLQNTNIEAIGATRDISQRRTQEELLAEISEAERRIRFHASRVKLADEATVAFADTRTRIEALKESHNQQAAACETARLDLKNREHSGIPEVYLKDARQHVTKCTEARLRYKGMITAIEKEVAIQAGDLARIADVANRSQHAVSVEKAFLAALRAQVVSDGRTE